MLNDSCQKQKKELVKRKWTEFSTISEAMEQQCASLC